MDQKPYLSVIISAYREEKRIGKNLVEMNEFLKSKGFTYEFVIVNDGSPDKTAEVIKSYQDKINNLRFFDNPENHGKGYGIRQGLLEARGEIRLFLDADGSTSITHLDAFLPEFKNGYDVVIGSRDIPGAFVQIHQAKWKEIFGDTGNWAIRILLGLWIYPDTQCGFKMLNAKAAEAVASRMVVDRFGFDFELIVLAKKLGFKIKQLPVRWLNEEGSTVKLTGPNGYTQVLIDLFKTRMRLWGGKYDLKNQKSKIKNQN
jgi:dolichyl-phosphate beta-glucosyltransferase